MIILCLLMSYWQFSQLKVYLKSPLMSVFTSLALQPISSLSAASQLRYQT